MQELKCAMITPYNVFKTSGHVDKFADFMAQHPVANSPEPNGA